LGGEARDRIAGFWRALGETPPSEPDHLTVLLAAYAELAERETQAANSADDEGARTRWRHARQAFLWEHLLGWLPNYLEKVGDVGSSFYRKWAELLLGALLKELESFPAIEVLPLHLREAPPLGDLRDCSGDEFLQAVTTPVRTGMILVRSDLERCARELGLGLRKGERRYALKNLLGQEPKETLRWLAGEADHWASRHKERAESIALISEFWRDRAEGTSTFLRGSAASLPAI